MPLLQFLSQQVFTPLQMKSVTDTDAEQAAADRSRQAISATRWDRCVLRRRKGSGWMFAAGELAMTAEDLAKWDISDD